MYVFWGRDSRHCMSILKLEIIFLAVVSGAHTVHNTYRHVCSVCDSSKFEIGKKLCVHPCQKTHMHSQSVFDKQNYTIHLSFFNLDKCRHVSSLFPNFE